MLVIKISRIAEGRHLEEVKVESKLPNSFNVSAWRVKDNHNLQCGKMIMEAIKVLSNIYRNMIEAEKEELPEWPHKEYSPVHKCIECGKAWVNSKHAVCCDCVIKLSEEVGHVAESQ